MDNRYFQNSCPALMQDARFITNYVESRIFEQNIRLTNNLKTAYDYKNFLQNNAEEIMRREKEYMIKNNTCSTDCSVKLSKLM